jgi:molybdopterin/thiamine biosynthesis adenylyltransferase
MSTETINILHSRFSDAPWANKISSVMVAGVGGIGSNLAYALARSGIKFLSLYDTDAVEEVNLGSQMFNLSDIGSDKVVAMYRNITKFNPNSIINPYSRYIDEYFELEEYDAVFSCFDNMKARKNLFESWVTRFSIKKESPFNIFIDARMEAETFQIYTVYNEEGIEKYRKTLFEDSILEDLPCNFKSTTHTSLLTSGMMTAILMNYVTNIIIGAEVRSVPFKYEFVVSLLHNISEDGL